MNPAAPISLSLSAGTGKQVLNDQNSAYSAKRPRRNRSTLDAFEGCLGLLGCGDGGFQTGVDEAFEARDIGFVAVTDEEISAYYTLIFRSETQVSWIICLSIQDGKDRGLAGSLSNTQWIPPAKGGAKP